MRKGSRGVLGDNSMETLIKNDTDDIFKQYNLINNTVSRARHKKKFIYIDLYLVAAAFCVNIIAIVYFLIKQNYSHDIAFVTSLIPILGIVYVIIRNIVVFGRLK